MYNKLHVGIKSSHKEMRTIETMEYHVYLDNSATTRVSEKAARAAVRLMTEVYGNPSSLHSMGIEAERCLNAAREAVAKKLTADPKEIVFTSGGTESNNLALFGAAKAMKRRGRHIVTTEIEHASVLESMKELEKNGYRITRLPVDEQGILSLEKLADAVTPETILVSVMQCNNETGAIQSVEHIKKIIRNKKSPALLHVDAVQAFGKLPLRPERAGIDLMSVSGHKIHAPKGVGALYISSGTRILPCTFGGGQERTLRPGTESLPLIGAFAAALDELPDPAEEWARQKRLCETLCGMLLEMPGTHLNSPRDGLPYIVNFSVEGLRSEILLHHLAAANIFVSSGSACAKGKGSHVLRAMGLSKSRVDSAIRVSFSRHTTEEEIKALVQGIQSALHVLAR